MEKVSESTDPGPYRGPVVVGPEDGGKLRSLVQKRHETFDRFSRCLHIGIHKHDDLRRAVSHPQITRKSRTARNLPGQNGSVGQKRFGDSGTPVARSVIHKDNLPILSQLLQIG